MKKGLFHKRLKPGIKCEEEQACGLNGDDLKSSHVWVETMDTRKAARDPDASETSGPPMARAASFHGAADQSVSHHRRLL